MQQRILLVPKVQKRKFFAESEFGVKKIGLPIDQKQFGPQNGSNV